VYAYNSVERDPGLLFIGITPKAESLVPRIEQVVERELARVRTELVTDRESEQFRNAELVNRIFSRDNVSYVGFFLAGTQIARGSWREFANDLVRVNKVTKEQVRDFCRQYLVEDNSTVGLLLNRKEEQ
jgi:predicted Zn-dependent peptidase